MRRQIMLLQQARREYLYHKINNRQYPLKQELIEFWGKECIKERNKLNMLIDYKK